MIRKTGTALLVFCAAFASASLHATAISFEITGQVATPGFTDTYDYFGGGTIAAGTNVSMSVTYNTAGCTYGTNGDELLYPCGTGAITESLTLGGYNYTDTSVSGNFGEIYQEPDAPDNEFAYVTGIGTAIQIFVYSTNAFQSGAILNGPPSNFDPAASPVQEAYVCVSHNCEPIDLAGLSVSSAGAPEPGPLVLLGSGLTALALLRFKKLRANRLTSTRCGSAARP